MTYSNRFRRIAQLLFTSDISEEEHAHAENIIKMFEKAESDLQSWVDGIENNLNVFKDYHGKETSLVVISEVFEKTMEKQKQKYEEVIKIIKKAIDMTADIQDIEMQDMMTNLTKTSEEYTELYNELSNLPIKIGEDGFIQKFKDISQRLLDGNQSFFDVLQRIKDYMMKNILGEQSLT